jgi:hypothetical protein
MGIYDAWNRLRIGSGIETMSLEKGEGPYELQALYKKWLEDIFHIPHPGYFLKQVEIYFIYKGVRYNFDKEPFSKHVLNAEKEGKISAYGSWIHGARFETLLDTIVIEDLLKIGVLKEELFISGSFD